MALKRSKDFVLAAADFTAKAKQQPKWHSQRGVEKWGLQWPTESGPENSNKPCILPGITMWARRFRVFGAFDSRVCPEMGYAPARHASLMGNVIRSIKAWGVPTFLDKPSYLVEWTCEANSTSKAHTNSSNRGAWKASSQAPRAAWPSWEYMRHYPHSLGMVVLLPSLIAIKVNENMVSKKPHID